MTASQAIAARSEGVAKYQAALRKLKKKHGLTHKEAAQVYRGDAKPEDFEDPSDSSEEGEVKIKHKTSPKPEAESFLKLLRDCSVNDLEMTSISVEGHRGVVFSFDRNRIVDSERSEEHDSFFLMTNGTGKIEVKRLRIK